MEKKRCRASRRYIRVQRWSRWSEDCPRPSRVSISTSAVTRPVHSTACGPIRFRRPNGAPAPPPGVPRGAVPGGKHKEFYKCSACGTSSRVKNNRAVAEEHERMLQLRESDPCAPACRTEGCANEDLPVEAHPGLYQRFGKTQGGDPRWRCKGCAKTFSSGKPARRHKRSDKNRLVLDMLCNDLSLAKVAKISGLSYKDIYRRIGFYHEQVRSFVARREDFSRIDFAEVGSRFAPDSQALTVNWSNRKRRFPVVFQHLCTVHARSGFIMEASLPTRPRDLAGGSRGAVPRGARGPHLDCVPAARAHLDEVGVRRPSRPSRQGCGAVAGGGIRPPRQRLDAALRCDAVRPRDAPARPHRRD